jgi:hypothetical protein
MHKWAEELDYKMPHGVKLIGMDSQDIVFGAPIYDSGNNRWGPLEADNVALSQVEMYNLFAKWFNQGGDILLLRFAEAHWGQEKFHIFIDTY